MNGTALLESSLANDSDDWDDTADGLMPPTASNSGSLLRPGKHNKHNNSQNSYANFQPPMVRT